VSALVTMAWAIASVARCEEPATSAAEALRERYAALSDRLAQSQFLPQQLYIESVEGAGSSRGEVFAVVDYPIATLSEALSSPAHWCDVLILHLNVKYCHPIERDESDVLRVAIGRKRDQPLSSAYRLDFIYGSSAPRPDYLRVELNAREGPFGTGNYRIDLEAVGLEQDRAFLHLQYSYTYGFAGRLAMQHYLATEGNRRLGFTIVGEPDDAQPQYIRGVRGAIERNTMRYYLAIDAYLGSLAAPAAERFELSLERCFSATERYPLQLHEVDRDTYVSMKRHEYLRQQTLQ
jgi:hypothetical protein